MNRVALLSTTILVCLLALFVQTKDVAFGVLERRPPAPLAHLGLRLDDLPAVLLDHLTNLVDRVDRDVVYEWFPWLIALYQTTVDRPWLLWGPFVITDLGSHDEPVVAILVVFFDLPIENRLIELLGSLHVVCWDLKMCDRIFHDHSPPPYQDA